MVLFSTFRIAIVACSLSSVQARLASIDEEPSLEDASGNPSKPFTRIAEPQFPTSLQDSAGIAEYHNRVCGAILAKGPLQSYELSAVADLVAKSLEEDPTVPENPGFDYEALVEPVPELSLAQKLYTQLGDIEMSIENEDGTIGSVDEMIAKVHGGCEGPEDEEMAKIFEEVAKASEVFWATTVPEGRFEGRRKLWFWKALKIAFADAKGALSGSTLGPWGAVAGGAIASVIKAHDLGVIGGGDGDNP